MNLHEIKYPKSSALKLPVVDAGPGYDILTLREALGETRLNALIDSVDSVFCANHAKYPKDHELCGYEVHCVYAQDLETFLETEAK